MGGGGEGLCRPYLGEDSVKGVSVLQHRRERDKGAESQIWVKGGSIRKIQTYLYSRL
jgi:hypothetical protein